MTGIMETTAEQAIGGWDQQIGDDQSSTEYSDYEQLPRLMMFAQKLIDRDPRMQALKATPGPTEGIRAALRRTVREIQQNVQYTQDDVKRLNPDATEAQVEEYVVAVFERDIVMLDLIQKEVQRKHQEKEGAEASDRRKSGLLNTTDIAQNGGAGENRFTGQNTVNGIRRILFGNS